MHVSEFVRGGQEQSTIPEGKIVDHTSIEAGLADTEKDANTVSQRSRLKHAVLETGTEGQGGPRTLWHIRMTGRQDPKNLMT